MARMVLLRDSDRGDDDTPSNSLSAPLGGEMNLIFRIILFCALIAAAGCKEILYSNLTEREANQMMAVLKASDVPSTRKIGVDGGHDLLVNPEDIAVASTLLEAQGLPRETFRKMDEIFAAEGLVGTPFEERVRYVFALEQKLAENLTSINGVRSVRVSINLSLIHISEPTRPY